MGAVTSRTANLSQTYMMPFQSQMDFAKEMNEQQNAMLLAGIEVGHAQNQAITAAQGVNLPGGGRALLNNATTYQLFQSISNLLAFLAFFLIPLGALIYGLNWMSHWLDPTPLFMLMTLCILSGYYLVLSTVVYYKGYTGSPKYFMAGLVISAVGAGVLSFAIYQPPQEDVITMPPKKKEKLNVGGCISIRNETSDVGEQLLNTMIVLAEAKKGGVSAKLENMDKISKWFDVPEVDNSVKCRQITPNLKQHMSSMILQRKYLKSIYLPPVSLPTLYTTLEYKKEDPVIVVEYTSAVSFDMANFIKISQQAGFHSRILVLGLSLSHVDQEKFHSLGNCNVLTDPDQKDMFDAMARSDILVYISGSLIGACAAVIHKTARVYRLGSARTEIDNLFPQM